MKNIAVVLGMFETGLGVARSLGRNGIKVYGFDFKKDITFYSKYVKAKICPHPLNEEKKFIQYLISFGENEHKKPVLFITSDDFLISVSRNKNALDKYFLINLPDNILIESIADKYRQYQLIKAAGIDLPQTFALRKTEEITTIADKLHYPAIIKGLNVNSWRKNISGSIKGFEVLSETEFTTKANELLNKKTECLVQEIIHGPDTNHYKFCTYFSKEGKMILGFTLQKIRQNPIRFGVGSVVQSIQYEALYKIGEKLFKALNYKGVGSAEFKLDERDCKLKLIEINARYWQQNALPDVCGMNFPFVDYLEMIDQKPESTFIFTPDIKWVNIYMDFDSFLKYRKLKKLTLKQWIKSLKGKKIYSDFAWDDILPGFYEVGFGLKLYRLPKYLMKRLFN